MIKLIGIKGSIKTLLGLNKGLSKHGDEFILVKSIDEVKHADCFLQTNLLKPKFYNDEKKYVAYEYILNSKKPFLVSESPSFRKYPQYNRLGWYSYKWSDGIFGNENSPPDRWNKFKKETGISIKDWNSPGDHILIMGQKEGDSSLSNLYKKYESFYDWVEEIIKEIRKYSDRTIIVRPHPRNLRHGISMCIDLNKKFKNVQISENLTEGGNQGGEGLERDLRLAYCVVTYNSLSAVESVCEGIPTFAFDNGSMIWPIAHTDLSTIESLKYDINITQWCYDIAYTQWSRLEHKQGESWQHLKPLIFKDQL